MSLGRYRPQGQPQQKIRPEHLDRAAVVYVRQSSRQQVLEHSESTRLQYALAERAAALGWARSQVVVIDDDLGVSAATADSRKGFARLVTEVTMGRVGVVLGIEMSRLARTGRDWHQLLELCSLSGVLLADPDGVYDPSFYNDRLLLGLKGTMSEAELYLIRQRMLSGKLAKAERGELVVPLPIGYARRPSSTACCATWWTSRFRCRSGCMPARRRGRSSGGARTGRHCRSCCTTRSTRAITPTAAARSSRAGRLRAGPEPAAW
jgi:DNA invertase Pin-like site-specific DNA recombinase